MGIASWIRISAPALHYSPIDSPFDAAHSFMLML